MFDPFFKIRIILKILQTPYFANLYALFFENFILTMEISKELLKYEDSAELFHCLLRLPLILCIDTQTCSYTIA